MSNTNEEIVEFQNSFKGIKGMSLRDYFASCVMESLIKSYNISLITTDRDKNIFHKGISKNSYEIADEMIKQRSVEK